MTVAIAGASGLTGSHCLTLLLQQPEITGVIAIGRTALTVNHPKLKQVMLQNGMPEQPVSADAFICCLGSTMAKSGSRKAFEAADRHLVVNLARQLQQQGCTTVAVVSSMGASVKSAFFYNRVKGAMEEDLKKLGLKSLHVLRPSFIDGNRREYRPMEKLALYIFRLLHPLMGGKLRHIRSIHAETIARGLVHCVLHPQSGHFTYLSGDIEKMNHP